MSAKDQLWTSLRSFLRATAISRIIGIVLATVILPIVEATLVNLLTGGQTWAGVPLLVIGLAHAALAWLLIWGEIANPPTNALDAIEAQDELAKSRAELKRRLDTTRLIRSAFDAVNLQTCSFIENEPDTFKGSLRPIIQDHLACGFAGALGITGAEFTIEVYFQGFAVQNAPEYNKDLFLAYFSSSANMSEEAPFKLGDLAPVNWGWRRKRPGLCCIEDDKPLFYPAGHPYGGLYFRRFATVPINYLCGDQAAGLLVVTSMQDEPFAEDILDTMQFIASLLSQFMEAYNRCVLGWLDNERQTEEGSRMLQALMLDLEFNIAGVRPTDCQEVVGFNRQFCLFAAHDYLWMTHPPLTSGFCLSENNANSGKFIATVDEKAKTWVLSFVLYDSADKALGSLVEYTAQQNELDILPVELKFKAASTGENWPETISLLPMSETTKREQFLPAVSVP